MNFDALDFFLSAIAFVVGIGFWFHREANKINVSLKLICERLGDLDDRVGSVSKGLSGFKADIDRDHRGHDDEIRTETKEVHEHLRGLEKKLDDHTLRIENRFEAIGKDITHVKAKVNGKSSSSS